MPADDPQIRPRELIARYREGDETALGHLLDQHRDWLRQVAAQELNGRVASRIDASDIVQQTLLSACDHFADFDGATTKEFAAWLGRIHQRNIQDAIRHHTVAGKRKAELERPITNQQTLQDERTKTPSRIASQKESADRLRKQLESLPEDQAEAVRLRHLEGWSLAQLSQHFGRSTDAVASLLKRGLENLRKRALDD